MILIISEETTSVNAVMNWLDFYKKQFIRINSLNEKIHFDNLSFLNGEVKLTFQIGQKNYSSHDFETMWVRHGFIGLDNYPDYSDLKETLPELDKALRLKKVVLEDFLHYLFKINSKKVLGSLRKQAVNKLLCLSLAKENGIDIPGTIICTTKSKLLDFFNKYRKKIITKSVHHHYTGYINGFVHMNYTEVVEEDILNVIPETFPPSQFQEMVEKLFEIRVFYINGSFYSMAILSQDNPQTLVDFRKYDHIIPNRRVPFSLPKDVESKLKKVLETLKYNTCSLDMIYTVDGKYIFLEINPVGQFGMVSYPCNYYLEEKIAKYLSDEETT